MQRAQLEELAYLLDDHPGLRTHAAHRGLHRRPLAFDRQRADQADDLLLRTREVVDQLGHVVLEELLALRGEERDDLLVVDRVRPRETEVEDAVVEIERHAAQAVSDGSILFLREGLGIDDAHLELPAGEPPVLVEQRTHAVGVAADAGHALQLAPREIEPQGHRLVEIREDAAGPFGEREQAILGEIDASRAEGAVREHVHREQKDDGEHDSGRGHQSAGHALLPPYRFARRRLVLMRPCATRSPPR